MFAAGPIQNTYYSLAPQIEPLTWPIQTHVLVDSMKTRSCSSLKLRQQSDPAAVTGTNPSAARMAAANGSSNQRTDKDKLERDRI
jgi:hypothetical protein